MVGEDKYEILGTGVAGGMGQVFKVRHRLLNEVRAIKVMRGPDGAGLRLRERFLLEARIAAGLRHPHLAQVFDLVLDEYGGAYMVLEWIDGLDLSRLLRISGPPPLPDALDIALQALSVLGYLHGQGIVHRDVSTDNFMVVCGDDDDLVVKLIDLGIAKRIDADVGLTGRGMFLGKMGYAAPETFDSRADEGPPDFRSDLYSFGVVLYELLTGERPVTGDSQQDLAVGHVLRPPRPFAVTDPSGRVPERLREIVLRALEKRPDRRFQSAADFAEAIRALQPVGGGEPEWSDGVRKTIATPRIEVVGSASRVEPPRVARPRGGEDREAWFRNLRKTLWLGASRTPKGGTSSLFEVVRAHPKPVAAIASAVLLAGLVFSFTNLSKVSGSANPLPEPSASAREETDPAMRDPGTGDPPGPVNAGETPPEPAIASEPAGATALKPAPTPRRVLLISSDARLAAAIQGRLDPRIEVVIRSRLPVGGAQESGLAIEASADLRQISVEAYDTLLPSCEASATLRLVEVPEGRSLFARTIARTAPRCGQALDEAARLLSEEVAPRVLSILGFS